MLGDGGNAERGKNGIANVHREILDEHVYYLDSDNDFTGIYILYASNVCSLLYVSIHTYTYNMYTYIEGQKKNMRERQRGTKKG